MTDNEIIKSYELCFAEKGTTYTCAICPYHEFGELCKVERDRDALNFINLQQAEIEVLIAGQETLQKYIADKDAEIERLQKENEILSTNADNAFQEGLNERRELFKQEVETQIKAEAVKELAEAFKVKFEKEQYRDNYVIDDEMLDNLVKEMVGDTQ